MADAERALSDEHWTLIEEAFPDREKLVSSIEGLSQGELVAFAAHVIVARNLVRQREDGPRIGDRGERLEPMTTEDLTEFIVGQGRSFWRRMRGADDDALAAVYGEYLDQRTSQLLGEVFRIYTSRFDDDLNDAVDAYLASLGVGH